MIAKSEGAYNYHPTHFAPLVESYSHRLVAGLLAGNISAAEFTNRLHRRIIDESFAYFAENAADEVLSTALGVPPYQRDRDHFDATNNRVRSVRAEIEKMRQRIIKLTEQQ